MNAETADPRSSTAHPAPHRHKLPTLPMAFGLLAAPLAWSADELVLYFIAAHECRLRALGDASALQHASSGWFVGVTLVTVLIALAGLLVSIRNWRRTRGEDRGSGHHLLEMGRGRTRFMAMWGMLVSIGFLVGFVFLILDMVTAPLCGK